MKIKILFLAANPIGTVPLALDEEMRAITEKLRAAQHRDQIEIVSRWAVRPDDLLQALNEHKPHIVHFSGHGSDTEEIILLDDQRNPKPVSGRALAALFTTLKDNIKVVVLNACYSEPQARAILGQIPCAIGMSRAIEDRAAITFAASFYRAIGFGRTVQEAFDQGMTALLLEGCADEDVPQLLTQIDVDAATSILAADEAVHTRDSPTVVSAQRPSPPASPKRTKVFISYSHADETALKRLHVHLRPMEREGVLEFWDDTRITPGQRWKEEIEKALASAKVAVLLVSADFLASDFIANDELPPLLAAAEREGLVILQMILKPCRFQQTPGLSQFQAIHSPDRPLLSLSKTEQEALWVKLTVAIEAALHP